jgi:hypothetical protein
MTICLFRRVTGRPCPACGSTRATLALLQGDVGEAWRHNAVWTAVAITGAGASLPGLVQRRGIGVDRLTRRWRATAPATKRAVGASSLAAVWLWNVRRWGGTVSDD